MAGDKTRIAEDGKLITLTDRAAEFGMKEVAGPSPAVT
jgi:hypothetical protein